MTIGLVDHFNIVISPSQVDETLRFYREVLGLQDGFRPDFGRPGWWLYAGGHAVLHISLKEMPPTRGSTGSFDHIALNATGWPEMKAKLERLGIPFREQLVDDNKVLQIFFEDTNGLKIELDFKLEEIACTSPQASA
jgi:catechol 2,3-dioxygenase-like lactoylglutathione lyase family enzyme